MRLMCGVPRRNRITLCLALKTIDTYSIELDIPRYVRGTNSPPIHRWDNRRTKRTHKFNHKNNKSIRQSTGPRLYELAYSGLQKCVHPTNPKLVS